jgi:hypothetical protein
MLIAVAGAYRAILPQNQTGLPNVLPMETRLPFPALPYDGNVAFLVRIRGNNHSPVYMLVTNL